MISNTFSILTNAQSRGIVKRLVTYYDESQNEAEKNKFVYNRVGDFPLVQLKKTEIKRNLVRSSSVRIAPPSKTIMNRDIRAAILRSNSFQLGTNVPKLMPTKMRVKDDDQIITNHDPLPIHESPQTAKSVLDALEKNCRKRINNEELTLDRNKRICATSAEAEVVDAPLLREFVAVNHSAKRGREEVSPLKNAFNDSPYTQMRKRLRTKNNALSSSLSSSHFALNALNQAPKQPVLKLSIPTTSTATQHSRPLDEIERQEKQLKEVSISSDKSPAAVIVSLPKTNLEKRLHLFNARVDPSKRRLIADDDDEIKINFVKPRENSQQSEVDILRHVEKQKLSAMLSGLSDGFKSPIDEIKQDFVDAPAAISFTTSTTSSTLAPIATAVSSSSVMSILDTSSSVLVPNATAKTGDGFSLISNITSISPETSPINLLSTAGPTNASSSIVASLAPSIISSGVKELDVLPKPLIGLQFGTTTSAEVTKTSFAMSPATPSPPTTSNSTINLVDPNKSMITFTPIDKASMVATTKTTLVTFGQTPAKELVSGFSFGNSDVQPDQKTTFSFGENSQTPQPINSSMFGTTNNTAFPKTSSVFGQSTMSPPNNDFGAKPFSFGSVTQQQTTQPATTGTFSFGGSTALLNNKSAPSNVFGTSSQMGTQNAAASFGFKPASGAIVNNSVPRFPLISNVTSHDTSTNNMQSTGATNASSGVFASLAPSIVSTGATGINESPKPLNTILSKPFSFGSVANNQQQPAQPATTGTFSFGGNAALPNNFGASSSNVFGNSSQIGTQNQQSVSASFTFKPASGAITNSSTPSFFGHVQPQNSSAAPPAYQFGNSQIGNNVSASFTFGGGSSTNGGQTSQPLPSQSAGFNFGGPQSAPVSGGGFSFQANSLQPQPSSSGGLFNIGTGGSQQQQRRPIRQATRRMK